MADKVLEELLVSSEVQTARDRLDDYEAADAAAERYPEGEQEPPCSPSSAWPGRSSAPQSRPCSC